MKIRKREEGQGLVEYALVLVLVAVIIIAILTVLGSAVVGVYARVLAGLNGQVLTGSGTEYIVGGYDLAVDCSGGPAIVTVSDMSVIVMQDGEPAGNTAVSITVQTSSNSGIANGTSNANGTASGMSVTVVGGSCPNGTVKIGNVSTGY